MKYWLLILSLAVPYASAVADIDTRKYVQWNSEPFDKFVKVVDKDTGKNHCTGQYVGPNIVLTALHCVDDENGTKTIINSDGVSAQGKVIFPKDISAEYLPYGSKLSYGGDDYAMIVLDDKEAFHESDSKYFRVDKSLGGGSFDNAGFGGLRVLSDKDIAQIKVKLKKIQEETDEWIDLDRKIQKLVSALHEPDKDGYVVGDIFGDTERLKASVGCHLDFSDGERIGLTTGCVTYGGNSGGAFYAGDRLYGILAASGLTIMSSGFNADAEGRVVLSSSFIEEIRQIGKQ